MLISQSQQILSLWEFWISKCKIRVCYLSSSSTGCYEPILSSLLLQSVCYCGCQSAASGTEWVTQRQRTTPQIELLHGRSPNLHTQRPLGNAWCKHQWKLNRTSAQVNGFQLRMSTWPQQKKLLMLLTKNEGPDIIHISTNLQSLGL